MTVWNSIFQSLNNWQMEQPVDYGWFHWLWIGIIVALSVLLVVLKKRKVSYNSNLVFGIFGFVALILEVLKQIMWSQHESDGILFWSYQWYAAPFQICTTPLFVSILLCFIKKESIREALYAYLAFFTIICTGACMVYPSTVWCKYVLVDIHTMYLHAGGLLMAIFLFIRGHIKFTIKTFLKGFLVFGIFVILALALDVFIYQVVFLPNGIEDTFNMFYISPYFPSTLPVFDMLWESLPYPVFLLIYVAGFGLGGLIVNRIGYLVTIISAAKRA